MGPGAAAGQREESLPHARRLRCFFKKKGWNKQEEQMEKCPPPCGEGDGSMGGMQKEDALQKASSRYCTTKR